MRYQLLDDQIGNFLIVDTWKQQVIGKGTKLKVSARMCQKLNRRLGHDRAREQFCQYWLTT